jgi:GcrA cell cycle regulator
MTWQGWTEEIFEEAKASYLSGVSAETIRKAIGCPTRSAVLGKMHRAGLSKRLEPSAPRQVEAKRERAAPQKVRIAGPPAIREDAPELGVTIMQLRPFHAEITSCRYPIGGSGWEMKFCGRNTKKAPYCGKCRKLAFAPMTEKRKANSVRGALWAATR